MSSATLIYYDSSNHPTCAQCKNHRFGGGERVRRNGARYRICNPCYCKDSPAPDLPPGKDESEDAQMQSSSVCSTPSFTSSSCSSQPVASSFEMMQLTSSAPSSPASSTSSCFAYPVAVAAAVGAAAAAAADSPPAALPSSSASAASSALAVSRARRPPLLPVLKALPSGLSAEQHQIIRSWRQQHDYHNNYGCDFIPTCSLGEDYRHCVSLIATSAIHEMQSGPGADDQTAANLVWEDAVASCSLLFDGLHLLVAAAHASDLLQYILAADRLEHNGPVKAPTQIVSFPWHYYAMGFTAHTLALTEGISFKYHTIKADATEQTEQSEASALQQLEAAFTKHKGRSVCVLEPLCIPGKGRYFRPAFLQAVQELCDRCNVALVADENLSAVRCGAPLLSMHYNLRPSYVMLGKAFGCALLLSRRDHKLKFPQAVSILSPAFQLVHMAFILRFMYEQDLAQHCAEEGQRFKQVLEQVVGPGNVRQCGLALWVDKNMERLPLASCVNGRILPRVDQSASQLQQFLSRSAGQLMAAILEMGPAGRREGSIFCCAVCSEQEAPLLPCAHCLRQYHAECKPASQPCVCALSASYACNAGAGTGGALNI